MTGKLVKLPRAEQWAGRICTQVGKSVEAIIDVGRLLIKAKKDLAHGEWGRMFEESLVPFSQSTAERLMAIADNRVLSNSAHVQSLPPSWGTLYDLSRVPDATLKNALKDGVITPDMPRKAVTQLQGKKRKRRQRIPAESSSVVIDVVPVAVWSDDNEAGTVQTALAPVRDLIRLWPEDRPYTFLIHHLDEIIKRVRRLEERRDARQVSA